MPTDFWFRFSTYLSLVLASLSLGWSERELLPEVTAFAVVVVGLLVASFFMDRRFELGLAKANALGLGIAIAAVVWVVINLVNPRLTLQAIDEPARILPLIGPVLLTLIPAKLLRPKHVGDWWAMHGVAVAAVALASSMTDDTPLVGLIAAYAVCSAWALVLFFYRRSGGFIPPIPVANRTPPPQAQLAPADPARRPPRWVFVRALAWLAGGAAVASLLFVAIPRSSGHAWVFTRKTYVTGETSEGDLKMDLSGDLQESDEVAFKVSVTDADGNPKWDLDPDQHWRGREYVHYVSDGDRREWSVEKQPNQTAVNLVAPNATLPPATVGDHGPGGYALRFALPPGKAATSASPLASPVRWPAGKSPVRTSEGRAWAMRANANVWPGGRTDQYTQTAGPPDPPDLGSPFEVTALPTGTTALRQVGPAYFREFARDLLDKLIAAGRLPAAARPDRNTERVADEHHEAVARAVAGYFARGGRVTDSSTEKGEFTYTTTLDRTDRTLDPLVDFLKNTRAGHCEWYAGATALVLRAVGVPAQLVTGFRGWDMDEEGNLVVRQRHAHAWVEVLVSRPPPPGFAFDPKTPADRRNHDRVWHWMTVDPTPGTDGEQTAAKKNWFEQSADWITDFLLRFDKTKQQQAVEALLQLLAAGWPWATGGAVVGLGGFVGWRWWTRRQANRPTFDGPDWYARFQAALAARGFTRTPGQTPREFADAIAAALPVIAEAVQFVTSKLYRVRYAGTPLKPDEEQQVVAAVEQMEQTLSRSTQTR